MADENPLHTVEVERRVIFNRAHALVYICALLGLVYHRLFLLFHSTNVLSFFLFLAMFISELIFAFMWTTTQALRFRPVRRQTFPERLAVKFEEKDFPALDVFICTADPYKEPPISVVNTALSAMAFDYPAEKISVYVSDDGGSELTLFAFMEAARFAKHWLPFCRENGVEKRCPEAYFNGDIQGCLVKDSEEMKTMYEVMKERVERVVERGSVNDEEMTSREEIEALKKWKDGFTRQDHPTVIEVLLESSEDRDVSGHLLPNLVYISREKNRLTHHNFKAGALNVLLRVSAVMSNAPLFLILDSDTLCNDPQAALRAFCYVLDPLIGPKLSLVQFPQYFHGINKTDIYHCEYKRLFQINSIGLDGLLGPSCYGPGSFFCRKAFHGSPFEDSSEKEKTYNGSTGLKSPLKLREAHQVSECSYEHGTNWGSTKGFRYGSLCEDIFTSYRIHCEGWRSVLCNPWKPAFVGEIPIRLYDVLDQNKRWALGLLEISFSKYCPLTFGIKRLPVMMALGYAHQAFWPIWSLPILTYSVLPQLALLNGLSLFPKAMDPWFYLYLYLFMASYAQDLAEFLAAGGTLIRWWNAQRMWMIRGVSSYLFGIIQFCLKLMGIAAFGFNITSKVIDDDQSKRYEQEMFDFGVETPLFIPLSTCAIINLISFMVCLARILKQWRHLDEMFVQLFISGFVTVSSWPVYEAMVLRRDRGRMPTRITIMSGFLAWALYSMAATVLQS